MGDLAPGARSKIGLHLWKEQQVEGMDVWHPLLLSPASGRANGHEPSGGIIPEGAGGVNNDMWKMLG